MYEITLICTAHEEFGKCNSRELYNIIGELNPEIIFEELSPNVYNQCYGVQNCITLETSAIKMYIQTHDIKHIPVVGSELSDDVGRKLNLLTKHGDYCRLIDVFQLLEKKYGFQFLNSEQCDKLFERMITVEKLILENLDDEILFRIYQRGNEAIDNYENEIIENIYRYSEDNTYNTAIMFIGVAHRKSIMQKIQEYQMTKKLKLNWIFYNNLL